MRDRETERQRDRETERQRDRETERQRELYLNLEFLSVIILLYKKADIYIHIYISKIH